MSLDFGFFCDIDQNLKAQCFLMDLLGNRSLFLQKIMVCDLWMSIRFFVVCQEDLSNDVLLCDVKLSRFSF